MKKIKKIKEIKSKITIVKEIKSKESSIVEKVAGAEESFRNDVSNRTKIKVPVLEAKAENIRGNTQIQEASREMGKLEKENKEREIRYGRRNETETRGTYNSSVQQYRLSEQINVLPEKTLTMRGKIEHEGILPKIVDSNEERAERYRTREDQKKKRRYPWEL